MSALMRLNAHRPHPRIKRLHPFGFLHHGLADHALVQAPAGDFGPVPQGAGGGDARFRGGEAGAALSAGIVGDG